MRHLYAYVAYESTQRLVEDGMSKDSQIRTRLVDSLFCITCSLENNCILCSALRYPTTFCYIALRFTLRWNFGARLY